MSIVAWRKAERRRLIEARLALAGDERLRRTCEIVARLDRVVSQMADAIVGSYWPMRGEPDLRAWIEQRADHGRRSALPSIVEKAAPLVYRPWRPGDKLVRGVWSIPEPVDGPEIVPDIVLAPVVGFDDACYRLGYGGGYFDRTLAKLSPRPLAIGVGYELAAMPSIRPLPHDIPMDVIITERRTISEISPARSSRA